MLSRLVRLFDRYAEARLWLEGPATALVDEGGQGFGRIERQRLVRNRLVIEGRTDAARIGIALSQARIWTQPRPTDDGEGRFTLDVPFEPGPFRILAEGPDALQGETPAALPPLAASLPGFSARRVAWARAALWLPYLWTVIRLAPQIWSWKQRGDPVAREAIRQGLHLVPVSEAIDLDRGAILGSGAMGPAVGRPVAVTVVMPVYNAFDLTVQAVARVLAHTGEGLSDWRLILVEDASTDPRLRPWAIAREQAAGGRIRLVTNPTNLGFVGAANRGLAEARAWPDDPVILLNSDALVPPGWAARLVAPLADPGIASVTPLSNDAEIFSVPVICRPTPLPAADAAAGHDRQADDEAPDRISETIADRLDRAAQTLLPVPVETPTGVGFCMVMSPAYLARLPQFDTVFGRGYGEETDWCQRARALGGRHLAATNLFVEHRSGASFGTADKTRLLAANGAIVSGRYPGYDREVQGFIRRDPLITSRLAMALSWAAEVAAPDPVPVYLAHAMGGGAEDDLARRLAADAAAPGAAVVLRVGQGRRWRIEVHGPSGPCVQGLTGDDQLMRALIGRLRARRIIYSCGVGDPDPVALPGLLLDLAGHARQGGSPLPGGPQPVVVLLHDFFPVSPSYTLLGADGTFHGVPLPGTAAGRDPAHRARAPGGRSVALEEWQSAWGGLLAAAEEITVFSGSSSALLTEAYPAAAPALRLRPHALPEPVPRIAPGRMPDGRPVIGVLGNIGAHKGAGVLQCLARDLARRPDRGRLVVLGQVDPAFPLAPPAHIHGSYQRRDLAPLVARYGISAWLIPSIWPETFSFTTHEVLATGMPVFAFDLGAQGEALRAALSQGAPGAILPLPAGGVLTADDILARLAAIAGEAQA